VLLLRQFGPDRVAPDLKPAIWLLGLVLFLIICAMLFLKTTRKNSHKDRIIFEITWAVVPTVAFLTYAVTDSFRVAAGVLIAGLVCVITWFIRRD
jgi:hypothetical protein